MPDIVDMPYPSLRVSYPWVLWNPCSKNLDWNHSMHLPLSWSYTENSSLDFESVKLLSNKTFVFSASGLIADPGEFCNKLQINFPKGFFLRGLSSDLARTLPGSKLVYGKSALLKLNSLKISKSLDRLVNRGYIRGVSREVPFSQVDLFFPHFEHKIIRPRLPQLNFLYVTQPTPGQRFFVQLHNDGTPVCFLSIQLYGPQSWHLEILARNTYSQPGDMEALILFASQKLLQENQLFFNLGEVPFVNLKQTNQKLFGLKLLFQTAFEIAAWPKLGFKSKALFEFKNKFKPEWEDRYLLAWPRLSLLDLISVAQKTNFINLTKKSIWKNLKDFTQTKSTILSKPSFQ